MINPMICSEKEDSFSPKMNLKLSNQQKSVFCKTEKIYIEVEALDDEFAELREFFIEKGIRYLIRLSEQEELVRFLAIGARFNRLKLSEEDVDFAYLIARYAIVAIDNAVMVQELIKSKQTEHELKIAKEIQISLMPSCLPALERFDVHVLYKPLKDVGGDYYDVMVCHEGIQPLLLADVEGKGLPAALLAASSQAVFRSLSDHYINDVSGLVEKANSHIYDFTQGNRFITLFMMLLNDNNGELSYVNAGHIEPLLISSDPNAEVERLGAGGFLSGFMREAVYDKATISLKAGDILTVFTDGVPEAENLDGEMYGEEGMIRYIREHSHLKASEIAEGLYSDIRKYTEGRAFTDDFSLMIIKAT